MTQNNRHLTGIQGRKTSARIFIVVRFVQCCRPMLRFYWGWTHKHRNDFGRSLKVIQLLVRSQLYGCLYYPPFLKQEARLSQRDRATLRVIEQFATYPRSFEMRPLSRACVSPY